MIYSYWRNCLIVAERGHLLRGMVLIVSLKEDSVREICQLAGWGCLDYEGCYGKTQPTTGWHHPLVSGLESYRSREGELSSRMFRVYFSLLFFCLFVSPETVLTVWELAL